MYSGDGEEREAKLDYWSDNGLTALIKRLEQHKKELCDGEHTLTIERVKEIQTEVAAEEEAFLGIIELVRDGIIASQSRYEIAGKIVEELEKNNYGLEGAVYEGDEQRNGLMAKVKNVAGEEVVVIVSPDEEGKTLNKIAINWHHPNGNALPQEEYRRRSEDLLDSLPQDIYTRSSESQCLQEEDTDFLDLDEVKHRPEEKQKTRVRQIKRR